MTQNLLELNLSSTQRKALTELKLKIKKKYDVDKTLIFGSVARNEADKESDLDLLVLTKNKLSHREKHDIYGITTDINLAFNTNISVLVVDSKSWKAGMYSVLAIKGEVQRDGVTF